VLLRGLNSDLCDMSFCDGHNVLAAIAKNGSAFAWRLSVQGDNTE